jgi:Cu+-exporting ATPase
MLPASLNLKLPVELGLVLGDELCLLRIAGRKALRQLTGVIDVSVNLATEQATLKTTPEVQLETLVEVVRNAGYDVARQIVELQIDGMNCASCVGRVEKALLKLTEVLNASVNLATEKVTIETLSGVSFALLAAAIAKAGYTARGQGEYCPGASQSRIHRRHGWRWSERCAKFGRCRRWPEHVDRYRCGHGGSWNHPDAWRPAPSRRLIRRVPSYL